MSSTNTAAKGAPYRANLPGIVIMAVVNLLLLIELVPLIQLAKAWLSGTALSFSVSPYIVWGMFFAYLLVFFWNIVSMVVPGLLMGKYGWAVITPYALAPLANIIFFICMMVPATMPTFNQVTFSLLQTLLLCVSLMAFFQARHAPESELSRSFAPYLPADALAASQTSAKSAAPYQSNLAGVALMATQMASELPTIFSTWAMFVAWCNGTLTYFDPPLAVWSSRLFCLVAFAWRLLALLFPSMLFSHRARIFLIPYAAAGLVRLAITLYLASPSSMLLDFGLRMLDCVSLSAFLRLQSEPNSPLSRTFAPYLPATRPQTSSTV